MKYTMFVATDAEPDTDQTGMTPIETWVAETDGRGQRMGGDRLATPETATTVRVRNGELLVSDGPFAETKEAIIGYDLLECADLDEALHVARTHPLARLGRIELRPFADDDA